MGLNLTELYKEDRKRWEREARVRATGATILHNIILGRRINLARRAWNTWLFNVRTQIELEGNFSRCMHAEITSAFEDSSFRRPKSSSSTTSGGLGIDNTRLQLNELMEEMGLFRDEVRSQVAMVWAAIKKKEPKKVRLEATKKKGPKEVLV